MTNWSFLTKKKRPKKTNLFGVLIVLSANCRKISVCRDILPGHCYPRSCRIRCSISHPRGWPEPLGWEMKHLPEPYSESICHNSLVAVVWKWTGLESECSSWPRVSRCVTLQRPLWSHAGLTTALMGPSWSSCGNVTSLTFQFGKQSERQHPEDRKRDTSVYQSPDSILWPVARSLSPWSVVLIGLPNPWNGVSEHNCECSACTSASLKPCGFTSMNSGSSSFCVCVSVLERWVIGVGGGGGPEGGQHMYGKGLTASGCWVHSKEKRGGFLQVICPLWEHRLELPRSRAPRTLSLTVLHHWKQPPAPLPHSLSHSQPVIAPLLTRSLR